MMKILGQFFLCKCRIIEKTAGYSLAVVTAIMAGVGVMMFLLPPVPGVPVYLALGIVLPAIGHVDLGKRPFSIFCSEQKQDILTILLCNL